MTGRRFRWGELSVDWIHEKLGLREFVLRLVGYKDRQQYVQDKVAAIAQVVHSAMEIHEPAPRIIVIEGTCRATRDVGFNLEFYLVKGFEIRRYLAKVLLQEWFQPKKAIT